MVNFLKKNGFLMMILVLVSETFVPFLLALFYPGYNHITMLISNFGEAGVPTQIAFKIWAITDGLLFIAAIPAFYHYFAKTSKRAAQLLALSMFFYALGDCIITGIVNRVPDAPSASFGALLHDYASGFGFVTLLFGIFVMILLLFAQNQPLLAKLFLAIFLVALFFMVLFVWNKIPVLNNYHLGYRGLWQRLNLLFMYLPYLIISIKQLTK